jgi:potassium/hydrogen antiporter
MPEIADFATLVLILAGGFSVAVLSTRLTERVPVPAPALFLAAAALASDLWPSLYDHVPILTVERIAVVALVVPGQRALRPQPRDFLELLDEFRR